MLIAKELKHKNIAEYLLYMWSVEDLIRAFQMDLEKINTHIIQKYQVEDTVKREIYEWYESLIDMMKQESVVEKGHIQLNKNILIQLNDMHDELLASGENVAYNAKFYSILPTINLLKSKGNDTSISDIETCFVFLYGILNLKHTQQSISPETAHAQQEIVKFLALMSKSFNDSKILD